MIFHIAFQSVIVLLSLAILLAAVSKRRIPRSLNYTLFALFIFVFNFGYLLEITAPTLEAAIVACKVEYLGAPFIAPMYTFVMRDYAGAPLRRRYTGLLLFIFPAFVFFSVLAYPYLPLFYANLTFATTPQLHYLVVSPTVLYHLNTVYTYAMALLSAWIVLRSFRRAPRADPAVRRRAWFFAGSTALLLVAQVVQMFFKPASGFYHFGAALTASAFIMGFHMVFFQVREWSALARDNVVENMQDAFILLGSQGQYLDSNTRARALFPALRQAVAGCPAAGIEGLPQVLLEDGAAVTEFQHAQPGGDPLQLRVTRTPLQAAGRNVGVSILMYDVSEVHTLMEELRQIAMLDSLTGMYNRGTFFLHAQRDFDLAVRRNETASLLMMDIDHFKQVNDVHGHLAGDHVLTALAELLSARLRHTDILGRYGGEEIAVWLPGATREGAALIADVIRRALEHTPFESEHGRFNVTISIGVATLQPGRHHSLEALIADADAALYRAKDEGRNRVVLAE